MHSHDPLTFTSSCTGKFLLCNPYIQTVCTHSRVLQVIGFLSLYCAHSPTVAANMTCNIMGSEMFLDFFSRRVLDFFSFLGFSSW